MIGFIGAMDIEVDGLAAAMEGRETVRAGGLSFHKGRIGECDVVVAMCGVGKVNAAACAATMIAMFHPDEIVDIGVAGGLLKKDGMATGDIVVSTGVVQHDMDVSPLGYAHGRQAGRQCGALRHGQGVSRGDCQRRSVCEQQGAFPGDRRGIRRGGDGNGGRGGGSCVCRIRCALLRDAHHFGLRRRGGDGELSGVLQGCGKGRHRHRKGLSGGSVRGVFAVFLH